MAVTEILVCANGPGLIESRLKTALQVAGRLASHIHVVFFRQVEDPATVSPYGPTFSYSPKHDLAQSAWNTEAVDVARAKALFERRVASNATGSATPPGSVDPPTASWSEIVGAAAELFPSCSRACDLIVAGGPRDASSSTLTDEISSLALLSSGRMTLPAPRVEDLAADLFQRVLIAWDDSAAVSRTMAQAMPLLMAAREVRLFIGDTSPERATPCNEILAYLRRKNIQPTIVRTTPALHSARETLVQTAHEIDASLIVMGAYKHSRAQEILLGGTTRHVVEHARCAVLMAH